VIAIGSNDDSSIVGHFWYTCGLGGRSGVGETASRIVVNTITLIGNPDGAFQTQMRYAAVGLPGRGLSGYGKLDLAVCSDSTSTGMRVLSLREEDGGLQFSFLLSFLRGASTGILR
jgi:hypothetical protein